MASTTHNPPAEDGDEDDPIVETYHILLKPELPAHQQLLVLQHPNRSVDYLTTATELRLKPNAGMVELDIPLSHGSAYDKAKGVTWGKALSQSVAAKSGGTHGLPGGFGIGVPPVRIAGGKRGAGDPDGIEVVAGSISAADFNEAVRRDKVLRTQVLGGQISTGDAETRYMVGVFSGEHLHLTPITSLAHLRPQLHHIDAKSDLERAARRARDADAGGPGGAAPSASQVGPGAAARAIHMTVKSAGAVEHDDKQITETMADRLRAVQTEAWRRLAYVDESTDDAWALYEESLVHRGLEGAATEGAATEGAAAKGKGREAVAEEEEKGKQKKTALGPDLAAVDGDDDERSLIDKVAALSTRWDEEELLHVVSGRERPRAVAAAAAAAASDGAEAAEDSKIPTATVGGPSPRKGQPGRQKSSAASTGKRVATGKAKAGSSKSTAMDID